MSDFVLSEQQKNAIDRIVHWYKYETAQQQVARIFGYAGCGKSTITRYIIEALGLKTGAAGLGGDVLYAAFTGKAALVMTRKGTPASTIHSLIYHVSEPTEAEIEKLKKEIAELVATIPTMGPVERQFEEVRLRKLELQLKDIHKPRFSLNPGSVLRDAKLLVLDEVSMVGDEMANDLLSFGKPVLVLGDPGQLPPVKGEGAFTKAEPDIMLTEVHRQAGESAIIRLATLARQSKPIPYGEHDAFVWKMRRNEVEPQQILRSGQVICGKNATRLQLNLAMKQAAGFPGIYPTGNGEKIICLKNRNDIGVINGMFLTLTNIAEEDDLFLTARIATEDGETIGPRAQDGNSERFKIYKGHFDDHVRLDPEREQRDYRKKRGCIEAVWGWAITCHKSQGSQWENVVVYDDGLGRTAEDRARWLYTAITRAERGLVLLD